MSVDREEIRWKFQVMMENVETVIERAENNRKLIYELYLKTEERIEKNRNAVLTGIGFLITAILTLVAADKIDESFLQLAGVFGLGGMIYYFIINLMLKRGSRLNDDINLTTYISMKEKVIPLKGMISTFALREDITKDDTDIIADYVSTYGKSVDYTLTLTLLQKSDDEKTSGEQFNHEKYRKNYEFAKSSLETFKKYEFSLGTEVIEEFITEFELNQKVK